jgi:hypothetical protein
MGVDVEVDSSRICCSGLGDGSLILRVFRVCWQFRVFDA